MTKPVFKTTGGARTSGYALDFKAGDLIFREGELGTEMYIIHEGQVEILSRVGEEDRLLAVLEKGDFFGEMSILEDRPRAGSVRALTDVRVLQINGSTFDQMLRDNPEIAVRMMRKLSRRLRETDDLLRAALGNRGASPAPELPTPDLTELHATGPERLLHVPSGMEFFLSRGPETTLGRKDPVTGIYPDIDLTPVDAQRSISRRHAKLYRRGAKYFCAEEIGTMNATYVNGRRLETGVPAEIETGDEVRLGMVTLRFEVP